MPDLKQNWKSLLLYLGIPIVVLLSIAAVTRFGKTEKQEVYSDIITKITSGDIAEFTLNVGNGRLDYTTRDGKQYHAKVAAVTFFHDDITEAVQAYNAQHPGEEIRFEYASNEGMSTLLNLLPTLGMMALMVLLFIFFMRRMSASMGGDKAMSFGKAKYRKETKKKTTFADVAGADEEKAELVEIVDFLKDPKRFSEMGAHIPRGVLLVGPPGTGKTLLARAVAGEAGVPFLSISGSDFVEMFVGVGASRVRDLFDEAKKGAPAIVFIDEIDAVGRQRGAGLGGGHDEREQTLNQLLVEMDGFDDNSGVIVMAATNRPDILDKALLRPGRFDRQITVNYPDVKGREEILKIHARSKPLGPDVSLSTIAKSTAGFTGADLENLLNEAALLTVRAGLKAITQEQVEEATLKVIAGTEKKSRVMSEKEKRNTAYHEAGHAVAGHYLPTQDDIHHITIIPRGMALGITVSLPKEDKFTRYKKEMEEDIVMLLCGRIAEALTGDDISTGASNDIERATQIARDMVVKYGMSEELGPILYGQKNEEVFLGRDYGHINNCSQEIAAKIDSEIDRIMKTAYARGEALLKEHIDQLYAVGNALIEREKLTGEEFRAIMNGNVGGIADGQPDKTTLPESEV